MLTRDFTQIVFLSRTVPASHKFCTLVFDSSYFNDLLLPVNGVLFCLHLTPQKASKMKELNLSGTLKKDFACIISALKALPGEIARL